RRRGRRPRPRSARPTRTNRAGRRRSSAPGAGRPDAAVASSAIVSTRPGAVGRVRNRPVSSRAMQSQAAVDVSVIVPAYRAAASLSPCLTSILAQDFDGTFEVVVCATGNRPEELEHLPEDSRLRLIVQET